MLHSLANTLAVDRQSTLKLANTLDARLRVK